MSDTRNSSFELLRLILMLMIIIHHSIVHGLGLSSLSSSFDNYLIIPPQQMMIACTLNAFCICAVNSFILISGYFGIKPTFKKIAFLLILTFSYSLVFTIIPYAISGNWNQAFVNILFLSHGRYWFILDYLFLMGFAPILNLAFEKLSSKKVNLFIIGLIIINCYFGWFWGIKDNINGYSLLQFILMYCIGRKIKLYNFSLTKTKSVLLYLICSLTAGISMWALWHSGLHERAWWITFYNNPLIIASSIGLFLVFREFHFKSRSINFISQSAFAIYLFQSSGAISKIQYDFIKNICTSQSSLLSFDVIKLPANDIAVVGEPGNIWLCIITLSVTIFVTAILIDSLRLRYLKSYIDKFSNNISRWLSLNL